jgi:hypothetical protein
MKRSSECGPKQLTRQKAMTRGDANFEQKPFLRDAYLEGCELGWNGSGKCYLQSNEVI